MKIYVAHSSSFDFRKELYTPLRASKLAKLHQLILPHEASSTPMSSKDLLKTCDLVLAEVSYPSTGEGIELGWADMLGIPIICLCKAGYQYSPSLKVVTQKIIEYSDSEDLIKKISLSLAE